MGLLAMSAKSQVWTAEVAGMARGSRQHQFLGGALVIGGDASLGGRWGAVSAFEHHVVRRCRVGVHVSRVRAKVCGLLLFISFVVARGSPAHANTRRPSAIAGFKCPSM